MKPFSDVLISAIRRRTISVSLLAYGAFAVFLSAVHIGYFLWRIGEQAEQALIIAVRESKFSEQPSTFLRSLEREACGFVNCSQLLIFDSSTNRVRSAWPDETDFGSTVLNSDMRTTLRAQSFALLENGLLSYEEDLDGLKFLMVFPPGSLFFVPVLLVVLLAGAGLGFLFAARRSAASVAEILGREISLLTTTKTDGETVPQFLTLEGEKIFRLLVDQEKRLRDYSKQVSESEKAQEVAALAKQVAHDIRSPLSALDMALHDVKDLPEDRRVLIRGAAQRIRDIANNLIGKKIPHPFDNAVGAGSVSEVRSELLSDILDSIVSEKRTQYRTRPGLSIELEISDEAYGSFAALDVGEMKRLVSNLINNSVEAMADRGCIRVILEPASPGNLKIIIADDGHGIPSEVLPTLGQKGVSFGKSAEGEAGSGLGLYYARSRIEAWGGRLQIESQPNEGTSVSMTLPASLAPRWFVDRITFPDKSKIVVLDDDSSIHRVWARRLSENVPGCEIFHFSRTDEFEDWIAGNSAHLYLLDYEIIGSPKTGLDLVEKYGIADKTILVTSHFDEPHLKEQCERKGVALLPKALASLVPIASR